MGLFASNRTIKLFFDEQGRITEKETPDWVEVLAELTVSASKKLQQAWGKARLEYKDGQQVFVFDNLENVPVEFLAEVIVRWSEKDPVNVETIRSKLRYDIAQELYNKLMELYGLR